MWMDPAEDDRNSRLDATGSPRRCGRSASATAAFPNFIEADEGSGRLRATYGEEKYERLVELKEQVGPGERLPAEPEHPAGGLMATGRLAGRRVLVVGGGQQSYGVEDAPVGNGRAIAITCAREGASVAVADIDTAAAEETAELARAEDGGEVAALTGDASDEEAVVAMLDATEQALGGVDGLVLNVGIAAGIGLENTSDDPTESAFAADSVAEARLLLDDEDAEAGSRRTPASVEPPMPPPTTMTSKSLELPISALANPIVVRAPRRQATPLPAAA